MKHGCQHAHPLPYTHQPARIGGDRKGGSRFPACRVGILERLPVQASSWDFTHTSRFCLHPPPSPPPLPPSTQPPKAPAHLLVEVEEEGGVDAVIDLAAPVGLLVGDELARVLSHVLALLDALLQRGEDGSTAEIRCKMDALSSIALQWLQHSVCQVLLVCDIPQALALLHTLLLCEEDVSAADIEARKTASHALWHCIAMHNLCNCRCNQRHLPLIGPVQRSVSRRRTPMVPSMHAS